ncbi:hypothetical protein BEL04_08365 [Mucilaginibacter sp. PPCGB 2223]|uniref:DNA translocase FtsK n=1 Tax=Mucilaginibacter sp. PPCGB 2223 TaxID=1886027 RepID=UPI0008252658|nr:DNA translocase FtsK [Mucilaginibacter sp. PPCGB 2223]OCX54261.1 hypothetical protein BEL04_08365 [Mucilaginibacter sp. PPCGB 2223]
MDAENQLRDFSEFDPRLALANYQFPRLDLLTPFFSRPVNAEKLEKDKGIIVDILEFNGVLIERIKATVGPTLTLFEIIPAPGVRMSKILALEADLALYLAAKVRVTGPLARKGTIGIEMFHPVPDKVRIRSLLASDIFKDAPMALPVAMGKTMNNDILIVDLAYLPPLLIAGEGKSVFLRSLLLSLLYKKHPAEMKLVLIDTSGIELTLFHRIERHFLAKLPEEAQAIVTDRDKALRTLNALCLELDARCDLLKDADVWHISDYNEKFVRRGWSPAGGYRYLPLIVVVIDEFAGLLTAEIQISRLAQSGRSAGIHLVIATQCPSAKVITSAIKASFITRLAFRVASEADSRTILDNRGAELLHGNGDMLLSIGPHLNHLQGALVTPEEIKNVCAFIGAQTGYADAWLLPGAAAY